MKDLAQLADYGPIGFMLLSVLLTVKILLDYFNDKSSSEVEGAISKQNDKIENLVKKSGEIQSKTEDMYKWHDKDDIDGVKIWHRKYSDDKRMLETLQQMTVDIDNISQSLRKLSYDIQTIREKIDENRNTS